MMTRQKIKKYIYYAAQPENSKKFASPSVSMFGNLKKLKE
jgi:hypothetical protein